MEEDKKKKKKTITIAAAISHCRVQLLRGQLCVHDKKFASFVPTVFFADVPILQMSQNKTLNASFSL